LEFDVDSFHMKLTLRPTKMFIHFKCDLFVLVFLTCKFGLIIQINQFFLNIDYYFIF